MSVFARLASSFQKAPVHPSPRAPRHHTLRTSPYRILIVPDAMIPVIGYVTTSTPLDLVEMIARRSVNLEDLRGIEDSEFFLFWDRNVFTRADVEADPPKWLIAQVNVYTRELKDLLFPGAAAHRFWHRADWSWPTWTDLSLARTQAGLDVAADGCEWSEDAQTSNSQHALLQFPSATPTQRVTFVLRTIDAQTDRVHVRVIGKSNAHKWREQAQSMQRKATRLAKNTRDAKLYVMLGKSGCQAMLAEYDVAGGYL